MTSYIIYETGSSLNVGPQLFVSSIILKTSVLLRYILKTAFLLVHLFDLSLGHILKNFIKSGVKYLLRICSYFVFEYWNLRVYYNTYLNFPMLSCYIKFFIIK